MRRTPQPHAAAAFTLIELLIVVAIIAVLAAIAVPNLLEARVRSLVARSQSDLRTLAVGLESYRVDGNGYPPHAELLASGVVNDPAVAAGLTTTEFLPPRVLTSPVAYLASVPADPFLTGTGGYPRGEYGYIESRRMAGILIGRGLVASAEAIVPTYGGWRLFAAGPDRDKGRDAKQNVLYDPTNGTISDGDLVRTQREPVLRLAADEGR